jgi:hypothetical protein
MIWLVKKKLFILGGVRIGSMIYENIIGRKKNKIYKE